MVTKKFDVFGIGNTLMDIVFKVDDQHLYDLDLKKGIMHLIPDEKATQILDKFAQINPIIVPAGATTNTLMGVSAFGGKCILCGKVGNGKYGSLYEDLITKQGIKSRLFKCNKARTGKVINLVTQDAERTFGVSLGAALNLDSETVMDEDIIESKCFYFTGYEFESSKKIIMHSISLAKENNTLVAMDLADPELIKRNHEELKELIKKVDILFMNENEALAFTGMDPESAVISVNDVKTVVVKIGKDGSLIKSNGSAVERIMPFQTVAVDTTGAGDMFAAGFLYGFLNGKDIKESGMMGSYLGSKVVSQMGAYLSDDIKKDIRMKFNGSF